MSSTALVVAPGGELQAVDALDLIAGSGKAASTKDKYTRARGVWETPPSQEGVRSAVHTRGEYGFWR